MDRCSIKVDKKFLSFEVEAQKTYECKLAFIFSDNNIEIIPGME